MAILPKILGAVVRNESMRLDPQEIYGWRVFALVFAACFGGMLFGWDTGAIGGILSMKATQVQYGYADKSSADKANITQNIVSTLQAGCFAACFITGWAADRFGRRASLIFTGLLTIVGVVFQASSSAHGSLAVMYVGRFIAGLACGAASTLTPLYISECAPRAIRGGLIAFYQLFNVFGIMTSFWVNYACQRSYQAPVVFAVPLSLQALPAVFLVLGMFCSPESPRWYAKEDHWEKATETLAKLRNLPANSEYVQNEIRDMSEQLEIERRLTGDATLKTLLKEMFTIPGNRKRAIISIVLMICQQLTGVNAINYYAPFIFGNLGLSGDTAGLLATGVYGVVKFVACFVFLIFVADSLGRRRSLIWTAAGQGIVLFIVGIYGRVSPPGKDANGNALPVSPFGYVAIVCIYLWAAFFQFGWGPACWIIISEIPTARLRATNVALGAATQWLFNFVSARTVLTMQNTMGKAGYGMFFMFGSFCFLMGVFVYFFVPETKGLSLEKMDELFGVTDLVDRKMSGDTEGAAPHTVSSHHTAVVKE